MINPGHIRCEQRAGGRSASIAWYRSSLATTVSHVPVDDLIVIVVGLPLVGTIGGWLLAGREPPAIARQPLE
jgi:hypothetical protein